MENLGFPNKTDYRQKQSPVKGEKILLVSDNGTKYNTKDLWKEINLE